MKKNIEDILLAKSGKAVIQIATEFINLPIGERTPTVSELEEKYGFSRGTIHNALKTLQEMNAVGIESKKHYGSFLKEKDVNELLRIIGIESLVGSMPLPYSKRYEGMATGLVSTIENEFGINSSLAFVRGAKNRINMLLLGRYDYAIVSLLAAKEMINEGKEITIVKNFGRNSYTSDHVVVFHDPKAKKITDGMKVGVDASSIDQVNLTKSVCEGIDVKMVNLAYSNVLKMVMLGEIDCAVWNKDEIFDKYMNTNYVNIDKSYDDTIAVLVASSNKPEMVKLLNKIIDVNVVMDMQKQVIEGLIIPTY